jgi:mRNA export factor
MSAFGTTTATVSMIAPGDCNVPSPGNDGISSLRWSPTANFLVSTNWDAGVRCWEVQEQGGQIRANPKAQVNHEANSPVLDSCFSNDGSTVFSVGCDKAVRMWRLGETPPNNLAQQIGVHDAPVKAVRFLPSNLVVSGGWDRKVSVASLTFFSVLQETVSYTSLTTPCFGNVSFVHSCICSL